MNQDDASGKVCVAWRDVCPKCGQDVLFFFGKPLCNCSDNEKTDESSDSEI